PAPVYDPATNLPARDPQTGERLMTGWTSRAYIQFKERTRADILTAIAERWHAPAEPTAWDGLYENRRSERRGRWKKGLDKAAQEEYRRVRAEEKIAALRATLR